MSKMDRNLTIGRGEHPIDIRLTDAALDVLIAIPRGAQPFDLSEHRPLLTTIALAKIAGREQLDGFVVVEAADVERLLAGRRDAA